MATFTVHFPPTPEGAAPAPEKIVLLRDEFSWPAFLFGPFWLLWRRAWLAAALWTLALLAAGLIGVTLHASKGITTYVGLAMGAILGFEGVRLVAWTLARRGYTESGVILGDDIDEAEEALAYQILTRQGGAAAPAQPATPAPGAAPEERRD